MGIVSFSENIVLVTLPERPQLSDELETINEIISNRSDQNVVIDFSRAETLPSSCICKHF